MVRVLHIVGSMHPGGMENFIMNLYRNIDRTKVQFDFIEHQPSDQAYREEIEALGGSIYSLPRLTSHPVKNLKGIRRLVRENGYTAVVRHTPNALVAPQLMAARKAGAKAICHSHNTTDSKKLLHFIGRMFLRSNKIIKHACSVDAGKWMYGNRPCQVIHNAIDVDRFAYDIEKRRSRREELGIAEDVTLYGHIANFLPSKNHTFLLDIFAEIAKMDAKAQLVCLGDGELHTQMEEKAVVLGIAERIHFLGIRRDADAMLSAMDVLIFPSIFEGLPLTLLEAQAAGLPILLSDTITKQVEVTEGLFHWKSLQQTAAEWAQSAIDLSNVQTVRLCQKKRMESAGYSIQSVSKWYEEFINSL